MQVTRNLQKEKGQSTVEFALIFPVVLAVIVGIMAVSLLFYSYVTMQLAVREGTSKAVHDPRNQTVTTITNLVRANSFSLNTDTSNLLVVITINGLDATDKSLWVSGNAITVNAVYYVPLPSVKIPVPGGGTVGFGPIPIQATSKMTFE